MRVLNKSNITLPYIVCVQPIVKDYLIFDILKIFKFFDQHAVSYCYIYVSVVRFHQLQFYYFSNNSISTYL